ncbi:hypothetical protein N7492_010291 [Penicillium capsulatum]|uniref:Uncharacterized protein n=1 Tax=Penicillium capsulatum TaxID=69766 RepID=A0A9W9HPE7_9EURO|nr:hypothetical protein N7492_010291 [Penicillium capsulatum]KAJ6112798.1 hypothetical protein N7512_008122 [Penicillium capsulatum]
MSFWVGWQLWEKLSVALVLVYGFCALAFNRWRMRRYTAAEMRQKQEDTEIYPMLTRDDVPFGARAIEQGIEVEGIWICNHNSSTPSPTLPGTPTRSQPASPVPRSFARRPASTTLLTGLDGALPSTTSLPPYTRVAQQPEIDIVAANHYTYEVPGSGGVYSPVMSLTSRESPGTFNRRSEIFNNEKRASFHARVWRASHVFESKGSRSATARNRDGSALAAADREPSPLASAEQRASSRIHRTLRRRSSEEFRRKMSQIFNDRIHMSVPTEQLQFSPGLREIQRRTLRQIVRGQFRS